MSLGIFRSIRGSYGSDHRRADRMIRLLNIELKTRNLPAYQDPEPSERGLRRLPCGNAGASTYSALSRIAGQAQLSWTLRDDALGGERWIALPFEFAAPFSIRVGRVLFLLPQFQDFASLPTIHREVLALAPLLKIPLTAGVLDESLIERLADCEGVTDDEPRGLLENERGLWLDLYCATKFGMEDGTPLVVA
jgi:hypothetical protein